MNLLAILGGIFLTITSFFSVPRATTEPQRAVLAVEATPTDTPVPTDIPPTETSTPTVRIWPTRIPTPTPDTRIDDLQKQVDEIKKQIPLTPLPKPKYLCHTSEGVSLYSNDPCPYEPTPHCEKTGNDGIPQPCD